MQKTAYELRSSDWSSDVCSSDLIALVGRVLGAELHAEFGDRAEDFIDAARRAHDWRFERSGHCLLLRKSFAEDGQASIAHSLVELVDLPAMAPFQRALGRLPGRQLPVPPPHVPLSRSEERRVGTEGVSTCSSTWSPDP